MSKTVRVMDYIPSALWPGIAAGTFVDDVSAYLNAAHLDAAGGGVGGGEVIYDAGGYLAGTVQTYNDQHIHGAWRGTQIKQVGSQSIFVPSYWLANSLVWNDGPTIEKFQFLTDNPAAGGYSIIRFDFRSNVKDVDSFGLPILLTSNTSNGTPSGRGKTGGHTFDNLYFLNSPRGAIASDGTTVTDITMTDFVVANCGAAGAAPAIYGAGLAGWKFSGAKMFNCAGAMIRGAVWNTLLTGCDIDWNGGDTAGLDFPLQAALNEGVRLVGNNFRIKAPAPSAGYIMVNIHGNRPCNLTHVANTYWVDTAVSGSAVTAIKLAGTSYAGHSSLNQYQGFTGGQIGNADALLP